MKKTKFEHGKKFISLFMVALLFATFAGPSVVLADDFSQTSKLGPTDPADSDHFGFSVGSDASNRYFVVGAPDKSGGGAAYVFYRGTGYEQMAKLTASDGASNDEFGYSVAIHHDFIVVGAPGDDSDEGSAYVFEFDKGGTETWNQLAKLTASDGAANDRLGTSIDIYDISTHNSDETVVVGAEHDGSSAGKVYVYENTGTWSDTTQDAILSASDGHNGNKYGHSVAVARETDQHIIVGSPGFSSGTGAAYIYKKPGGGWSTTSTHTAKLTVSEGSSGDDFGEAVDISALFGTTDVTQYAIVGAPSYGTGGKAYIFERPENLDWSTTSTYTGSFLPDDLGSGDNFGTSVTYYIDRLAIGAPNNNTNQGAVYIFSPDRNGWATDFTSSYEKQTGSDSTGGDEFGISVSMDGSETRGQIFLTSGAHLDDEGGTDRGMAFLYTYNPTEYPQNEQKPGGGGGGDRDGGVPEFQDYIYILTILIAVGMMYKVMPKFSIQKK
ncbi:hypothetical protein GF366_03160 [Candidatus Peregrinibacteria bacterium]|nr:hypothetical protein [Candidatus Peregrinibacteria bacterium]